MRRLAALAIHVTALSLLVLASATVARADEAWRPRRAPVRRPAPTFDISGVYGGVLNGRVVIDNLSYPLGRSVQVYQLGVGVVGLPDLAIGSRVFASGPRLGDTGTVLTLIARPAYERGTPSTPVEVKKGAGTDE
jgi:hypothetical protein